MTAKTLRREPVNLGVAFSVVFHAALIAYLVYMVHPHASFLSPPANNLPVVDLSPPAPPAPPKPKTAPPKPVPPQAQTPQADQLQAKSDNAPPAETAPPVPSESAPPRVVGTVVPQSYFSALESLIQKSLQYPARSVANDEEGGCTVRVTFARDGMIESTQMAKASGYGALDGECREVFKRIGRFPPVPVDTSPTSTDFTIELPISFALQ